MAGQGGRQNGTAVARSSGDDPAKVLATNLKKAEGTLLSFLGSPEGADRAIRVAFVLVRRNPDLQECSVESIVTGMLMSAQLGLELGTEAYLVPFFNKDTKQREAAFIPDWKGLVRLAIDAGSLIRGHADLVYKNDEYRYERTGDSVLFRHVRERFGARAEQDTVGAHLKAGCQGVYFIGYTADSQLPVVAEMPVSEVEWVRKTYSKQADGPLWTKRWSAGAMKTVTKQALKLVPKSPKSKLQQAIELDNRVETGIKSGVLEGDEVEVQPFREPQPLPAGESGGESAAQEDARARAEDAKLAKE